MLEEAAGTSPDCTSADAMPRATAAETEANLARLEDLMAGLDSQIAAHCGGRQHRPSATKR